MNALIRLLPVLVLALPLPAGAQSLFSTWTINSDYPTHLGQAQSGRVALTESDFRTSRLYSSVGLLVGQTGPMDGNPRAIESTNGSLYFIAAPAYVARAGGPLVQLPTGCKSAHLVPLDGGRILVRTICGDPSQDFRIYDQGLTLVGSWAGLPETSSVPGMTRRPDGSIVACAVTLYGTQLTAYSPNGAVLWDHTIDNAGPVASDAEGNLYVLIGTYFNVYDSHGNFHHTWAGVPGHPLSNVRDVASSADGTLIFTMSGYIGGPVNVYSQFPTPARSTSWGQLKIRYGIGATPASN